MMSVKSQIMHVIDGFLPAEEADLLAEVITHNTLNCGDDPDYVSGVMPALSDAFAARLGDGWEAVGEARFTCRWSGVVEPHRDWLEPDRLWVLLVYLNTVADGGRTLFYDGEIVAVKPTKGMAVLFDGYRLHAAEEPMSKKMFIACDLRKVGNASP